MRRLFHAIAGKDKATNQRTLMRWSTGELVPRSVQSLEVLARIEHRYKLPPGYFKSSTNARYDQTTFYEAWRLIIQRHGIYNPYTNRGAVKGLLPHGPHNVRDVLATHILKKTGSYEQASYAIQDTPDMVQQYYGRFLPQDKAAIAAQVLNRVWDN